MGLQVIWSLVLAVLDAYAFVRKKALHNPVLVSLFVVGDWVSFYETMTIFVSYVPKEFCIFSNCHL
jgi:hypothetical protein